MCGRFSLIHDIQAICKRFDIPLASVAWKARYNLAPTQPGLVIIQEHARSLREMRWGLMSHWSKTKEAAYSLINARAESLFTKPTFKSLVRQHRCLVPADGFYEWKETDSGKKPLRVIKKDRSLFAFAGFWDSWQKEGEQMESFTIVTTQANDELQSIHDRMPVILTEENERLWLDQSIESLEELEKVLIPYPKNDLAIYEVSKLVNTWKVDSPECIDPVAS